MYTNLNNYAVYKRCPRKKKNSLARQHNYVGLLLCMHMQKQGRYTWYNVSYNCKMCNTQYIFVDTHWSNLVLYETFTVSPIIYELRGIIFYFYFMYLLILLFIFFFFIIMHAHWQCATDRQKKIKMKISAWQH